MFQIFTLYTRINGCLVEITEIIFEYLEYRVFGLYRMSLHYMYTSIYLHKYSLFFQQLFFLFSISLIRESVSGIHADRLLGPILSKQLWRRVLGGYFACYAILIDCLIASSGENNSPYLFIYPAKYNPRHFIILICHIRGNFTFYCMCATACRKFLYVGCFTIVRYFKNIFCASISSKD